MKPDMPRIGMPSSAVVNLKMPQPTLIKSVSKRWTASVHTRREAAPTLLEFPFYRLSHQPTTFTMRAILLLVTITGALSFQPVIKRGSSSKRQRPFFAVEKMRPGSLEEATAELGRVPYGESSRKYRRSVFTHDDWLAHRSNDGLLGNLASMFFSGVVRQVKNKILLISSLSVFVIFWNDYLATYYYTDLWHLCLPSMPFSLSSPALGLLLVFRTNTSYQRWREARNRWGTIVAHSRNMIRMASTFVDTSTEEGKRAIDDLARAVWVASRTIMNKLAGSRDDDAEYETQLREAYEGEDDDFVDRLLSAPDRTAASLMEASLALDLIPVDEKRRVEIDKSLVILGDALTACDRIFSSPVPLVYTRHTARFLSLWMLMLPFALHDEFVRADQSGLPTIPTMAILSLFLFGIEELAVQLEEPFSILPMQKFCDEIRDSTQGLIDWSVESRKARRTKA
jgi:putative membrane protein